MKDISLYDQFHMLQVREDVAELLGIEDKKLRYYLYGIRPDNLYEEFQIPKKNGDYRVICAPKRKLKTIQRKLLKVLKQVYKVKAPVHGFVNNKSNVSNATNHCKRKYVFNIDLENFFSQIHFGRVRGMLLHKPYEIGQEAATVLSQLVCYKGKVPQGAPTSPIITNMVCAPLDSKLTMLAKKYKMVYTRYADDITFSSYHSDFPEAIATQDENGKIVPGIELQNILDQNGFSVNTKKSSLYGTFVRQEVTGLVVNEFVNLKREYYRELRAILHNCQKKGIYITAEDYIKKGKCKSAVYYDLLKVEENPQKEEARQKQLELYLCQVLRGKIEYIRCVRGEGNPYFIKFAKQFNSLFESSQIKYTEIDSYDTLIKKNVCLLQRNDSMVQGSGCLINNWGLLTNYHVVEDNAFYKVTSIDESFCKTVSLCDSIKASKEIDYALFSVCNANEGGFKIGDSDSIHAGDLVKIVGFADYTEGDSVQEKSARTTGIKRQFGQKRWAVDTNIYHGESGGPVLNENNELIGLIVGGKNSAEDTGISPGMPTFIPINSILNDIRK